MFPTKPLARFPSSTLRRTGRMYRRQKYLSKPGYEPPVQLRVGQFYPTRVQDHYHDTLAEDLMYMQYEHLPRNFVMPPRAPLPKHDTDDNPYAVNRPTPRPKGNRALLPREKRTLDPESIIQLKKIHIQITSKEALSSKINLLNAMFQLRALSGENRGAGGWKSSQGVEIVYARANIPTWRIRRGVPMGVKVTLQGPAMWTFLGSFSEFVLPRIREFPGLIMPAPSTTIKTASMMGGAVSCGFKPEVMELFPQIEVNQDMYPKMSGFHLHFVTNARGKLAQQKARALLSGFQIPFIRK